MCVVSNVGDYWEETFPQKWPDFWPIPETVPSVTPAEFEALRKEVIELKELLKAAKKFDEATNQPNCEMEEKIDLIRKIAKLVGVDVDDVFGKKKKE